LAALESYALIVSAFVCILQRVRLAIFGYCSMLLIFIHSCLLSRSYTVTHTGNCGIQGYTGLWAEADGIRRVGALGSFTHRNWVPAFAKIALET